VFQCLKAYSKEALREKHDHQPYQNKVFAGSEEQAK
jgi:hypothetical protein